MGPPGFFFLRGRRADSRPRIFLQYQYSISLPLYFSIRLGEGVRSREKIVDTTTFSPNWMKALLGIQGFDSD